VCSAQYGFIPYFLDFRVVITVIIIIIIIIIITGIIIIIPQALAEADSCEFAKHQYVAILVRLRFVQVNLGVTKLALPT